MEIKVTGNIIWSKLRLIILLLILGILNIGVSQTLRAKVSIRADRLALDERNFLQNFPAQLENYINHYDWTGKHKDLIINFQLNFVIEAVNNSASGKIYQGQLLTISPSGVNILDKSWNIPYQQGQAMEHQRGIFEPLVGLIDYYVYMVIAGELDSYLLNGGNFYYNQIKTICDQGMGSRYSQGWRQRREEVDLITRADHIPLRKAIYYYYEGLFFVEERQDAERAPQYAAKVVGLLQETHQQNPNSKALKRFLDTHYQEFCNLFFYDKDDQNIQKMIAIDNRHRETYEQCAEKIAP